MGTHPIFESDFDCLTDFMAEERKAKAAQKKREAAEKRLERENKKVYSEKHSVKFTQVEFSRELKNLEIDISNDKIFTEEEAKFEFIDTFSEFPLIKIYREVPFLNENLFIEYNLIEEEVIAICVESPEKFQSFRNFCSKNGIRKAIISTMTSRSDWENKLVSHNLDLSQNLRILQTSTQRNLAETICLSIRSLVRRVPLIQKEVGEITEKVRVKDSTSSSDLWFRMLLTIDGVGKPELEAIKSIVPDFKTTLFKIENDEENLFETLCQTQIKRGEGNLERVQRLGPKLAQRIINVFDQNSSDFVLN